MSWKRLIGYGCFIIFIVHFSIIPYLVAQTANKDEDVRVVHNKGKGKWADNPHLSLKLIRVFGGINTKDESQIFNRIVDMVLDNNSNLYFLDSRDCRIQKFNPEGEFLTRPFFFRQIVRAYHRKHHSIGKSFHRIR